GRRKEPEILAARGDPGQAGDLRGGCTPGDRVVVWPAPVTPDDRPATARRPDPFSSVTTPMDAWPRCLERLEAELPAEDVHTWLRPLRAGRRASGTVLYAPNAFVRDEGERRSLQRTRELRAHFGGSDGGALEIGSRPRAVAPAPAPAPPPAGAPLAPP